MSINPPFAVPPAPPVGQVPYVQPSMAVQGVFSHGSSSGSGSGSGSGRGRGSGSRSSRKGSSSSSSSSNSSSSSSGGGGGGGGTSDSIPSTSNITALQLLVKPRYE